MRNLRRNPLLTRLMTVILTVCLSVCCCQASFLLDDADGCATMAAAMATCCSACSSQGECPPDDDESTPGCGFKACCIKGSGQKDGPPPLPSLQLIALVWTSPSTTPATPAIVTVQPHALRPPRPDASLLRLGCALII